ncbi:hypothetical protein ACFV27_00765 [Streptomyces antimycoticus]|uniref:hypothetical protein n=1 Tax=Streptomyces antimycoticus TaxID=68175 RepID=UPI0036A68C9D
MPANITPSKPQPKPRPLTADERERLARHEDTPDSSKSEAELLDELRLRTRTDAWNRYRIAQTIRTLLPEGAEVRRGLVTDVTDASPYKREYVGRIRDGLAANYRD